MENNGNGRSKGRAGGRRRGKNHDQHDTSNPSNYQSNPVQQRENRPNSGQGGRIRQEPTPNQGQSGEPRKLVSGHDRGLKEVIVIPISSRGQLAEPTKPVSAWNKDRPTSAWVGSVGARGIKNCSGSGGSAPAWKADFARSPDSGSDIPISGLRSITISCSEPPPASPESRNIVPVRRPDKGGKSCVRKVRLLANHFPISFDPNMKMLQYNIGVEPGVVPGMQSQRGGRQVFKSDIRLLKDKVFSNDPTQFPASKIAYDGDKIIVSAVELPNVESNMDLPRGKAVKPYTFTMMQEKELELEKLIPYLNGTNPIIPREILHGLDLVMKENPKKHRVQIGQSFYSMDYKTDDDLGYGVVACRGFQQSLRLNCWGPTLCVDYSVMPFRKPVPVLDFLQQRVGGFHTDRLDNRLKDYVEDELRESMVAVNHRETKQKFKVNGLTGPSVNDLSFMLEDREGTNPPQEIKLVDYFRTSYNREIEFKNLPALDLGKSGNVPMECCVLTEGQTYPKDRLDENEAAKLKSISLPKPWVRKKFIDEMVKARDGPLGGETVRNFGIEASTEMTQVVGRVIRAPDLKLGDSNGRACKFPLTKEDCQWNLDGRTVLEGKDIERWAVLEFTSYDRRSLNYDKFVQQLKTGCSKLGIVMKAPLFRERVDMSVLFDTGKLRNLLSRVYDKANRRLQVLVCPLIAKNVGYRALKWICETQIGIVTQLCLISRCNMGENYFMTNLALQINTKLGGSNFELFDPLPRLGSNDHVMFIGADVNHPSAGNKSSPSVAAVVATMNWPGANKYIGRYRLQKHRTEKILDFGEMCLELLNKYAEINKVKPKKIMVYRDGVGDSQFEMVLEEELMDIRRAIQCDGYSPTITLVVAQKRHLTRLFPMDDKQGARNGNVLPGTVVDTNIVHPWNFDFYLCSHYGILGTSKPTHYYCLWDDHKFSSDELQQITYNLCYTYARCTKPVSLVPPAFYADRLAYKVRQYFEAWEAEAGVPSSKLQTQFDSKIFERHNNLENVMFFC